jgi:hypothetical protein
VVSAALHDETVKVMLYQVMELLLFVMGGKSWVVEEVAVGWLPASIATKRAVDLVGVVVCHNNYSDADAAADNNAAVGDD